MTHSPSELIVEELKAMKQRMDVLFDETVFESAAARETAPIPAETHWNPPMDVWETPEEWVLKADLPGLRDQDVAVQVTDGTLTVSGSRHVPEYPVHSEVHVSERPHGTFDRSFALPRDAREDCIEARFEAGVLTVTVQRKRAEGGFSRKIPVRAG